MSGQRAPTEALISSHILSEVQALRDRVEIQTEARLAGGGRLEQLRQRAAQTHDPDGRVRS